MKRYVVFFILFNSFVLHGMALWDSCLTAELHKAYNRLKSDTTQKAQEDFFWAFPRNWNEYLIMEYEVSNRYEEDISNYIEAFWGTYCHQRHLILRQTHCCCPGSLL